MAKEDEENIKVIIASIYPLVDPKEPGQDQLEDILDKYIVQICRTNGLPNYEWDRPVTYTGNLRRLVSLSDIKNGIINYVPGPLLFELSDEKKARLIFERQKRNPCPPILGFMFPSITSSCELTELLQRNNEQVVSITRNVIGTCRAILLWYEKYYSP
ncbi:MAG: hypothetical protein AABX52_04400 [Nanoarchaeota archaeon]